MGPDKSGRGGGREGAQQHHTSSFINPFTVDPCGLMVCKYVPVNSFKKKKLPKCVFTWHFLHTIRNTVHLVSFL